MAVVAAVAVVAVGSATAMLNSCVLSKVAASKRGFVKDVTGSVTFCSPLAFALALALVLPFPKFRAFVPPFLALVPPFLALVPLVLVVISMLNCPASATFSAPKLGFPNDVTSADSILDLLSSASRALL